MSEYLHDFVPCLHQILKSQTIKRQTKLPAMNALGDLSLNIGDTFNKQFLTETLGIFQGAAEISVSTETITDPETLQYMGDLRNEILHQYICILTAVGESEDPTLKQKMESSLNGICDFLEKGFSIQAFESQESL